MPEGTELWVVGKVHDPVMSAWEFQGVFATKDQAIAACRDGTYFIGPALLDVSLPHESDRWPGAYYPVLEQCNSAPAHA